MNTALHTNITVRNIPNILVGAALIVAVVVVVVNSLYNGAPV